MTKEKKIPHVHAECIKAWADGAKIQWRPNSHCDWTIATGPSWFLGYEYRVKPEPKPDFIRYAQVDARKSEDMKDGFCVSIDGAYQTPELGNLKLTFDGETGKLKSADVL